MKRIFSFLLVCLTFLAASAQGESRENPIRVTANGTFELRGQSEQNLTTWFVIPAEAFGDSCNMLTVSVSGGNYGDVEAFSANATDDVRVVYLTAQDAPKLKWLWEPTQGDVYVAISQDNEGGKATFTLTKALPGEVRESALEAVEGVNNIPAGVAPEVWFRYTATQDAIVNLRGVILLSNVIDAQGFISCIKSAVPEGFRLQAGAVVYFQLNSIGGDFSITLSEIPEGYYADKPIDVTEMNQFEVTIPNDPNATTDSAAQSELYWLYHAQQSGHLMWGTDDSAWIAGMWGASVTDQTTGKRLGTPLTEIVAGMLTYTVNVEAGHDYLIAQTIGHGKGRQANVYLLFTEGVTGDTKENPIPLTLGQPTDLGRKAATTRYYLFTALADGTYTATIHAGGQVRATTPRDGSWNIGRDYSIQDRQMHIDDNIPLKNGETLLLEVSLTSDIDIHVDGSDADKPNYSILITLNEGTGEVTPDVPGIDPAHAIVAEHEDRFDIPQNSDEDYFPHYYAVDLQGGLDLYVVTHHSPAINSPACVSFSQDGGLHWGAAEQDNLYSDTILADADGKKVGRQYEVMAKMEDRHILIRVEGVGFLYEGATWQLILSGTPHPTAITHLSSTTTSAPCFDLQGRQVQNPTRHGIYFMQGRKVVK